MFFFCCSSIQTLLQKGALLYITVRKIPPILPPRVSVWVVHLNTVYVGVNLLVSTNGIKTLLVYHH